MTRDHDNENDVAVTVGTSAFQDLKIKLTEEDELKICIARAISNVLVSRKLTQQQAAEIIGIDQPKISNVVRGQLSGLSVERLFHWLQILGFDIEVQVKKSLDNRGKVIFHEAAHC